MRSDDLSPYTDSDEVLTLVEASKIDAMNRLPPYLSLPRPHLRSWIGGKIAIALLDTGCQMSTISAKFAKEYGLGELIDYSADCHGTAIGFGGESKIIGRIHYVEMDFVDFTVPFMFDVMKLKPDMDQLIFGIDFFIREKCQLNMKKNQIKLRGKKLPLIKKNGTLML